VNVLLALATPFIPYLYYRVCKAEKRLQDLQGCSSSCAISKISSASEDLLDRLKTLLDECRIKEKKKVKIFMDGAFDLTHYGHWNAFRQARLLGDYLIVGVNSDESIKQCKGPPILNDSERQRMVLGCRFVDEIIPNVPYVMSEDYLLKLMEEHEIDYFVHGDDPCTVDGRDVYAQVKEMGKFKSIPRTEGVSSTDIVGRMMMLTNNVRQPTIRHEVVEGANNNNALMGEQPVQRRMSNENLEPARTFYPTSRMLRCFAGHLSNAPPKSTDTVVYIAGEWDMFNATHVLILEKAKARGDYLYVGIHTDDVAKEYTNGRPPIFNLYERVLSVLGCKFVDDVILGADITVTKEKIQTFGVKKVVMVKEFGVPEIAYDYPKKMGILEVIENVVPLTPERIATRLVENLDSILHKHQKKAQKEKNFYDQKYGA